MRNSTRYPNINIDSKNGLAKRISNSRNPQEISKNLALINDVLRNFDKYWHDSNSSEPIKNKFVRTAINTPLGELLKIIDRKILMPYDNIVPNFIFGGLSGRDHIHAAASALGLRRKRTMIKLDIARFFEQISERRVFLLFHRCACSTSVSKLLAQLCCVPTGPKQNHGTEKVLARGFATSSRLAVWCNLDTFLRLKWKTIRLLKNHDPRIVVFVDDIGVFASRVDKNKMDKVSLALEHILYNQKLPINPNKKIIRKFSEGAEFLGIKLGKNKLSIGGKARSRRDMLKIMLSKEKDLQKKKLLQQQYRSHKSYENQLSRAAALK